MFCVYFARHSKQRERKREQRRRRCCSLQSSSLSNKLSRRSLCTGDGPSEGGGQAERRPSSRRGRPLQLAARRAGRAGHQASERMTPSCCCCCCCFQVQVQVSPKTGHFGTLARPDWKTWPPLAAVSRAGAIVVDLSVSHRSIRAPHFHSGVQTDRPLAE